MIMDGGGDGVVGLAAAGWVLKGSCWEAFVHWTKEAGAKILGWVGS